MLDDLFRKVLTEYQSETRPLCQTSAVTGVNIDFALRQIIDMVFYIFLLHYFNFKTTLCIVLMQLLITLGRSY